MISNAFTAIEVASTVMAIGFILSVIINEKAYKAKIKKRQIKENKSIQEKGPYQLTLVEVKERIDWLCDNMNNYAVIVDFENCDHAISEIYYDPDKDKIFVKFESE